MNGLPVETQCCALDEPSGASRFDQVGYFLSPFDFRRLLLTFFLFSVAFNRFVLFLRFITLSFQ